MTRTRCITWITAVVLLLVAFSGGSAQEPKPSLDAKAPVPPKGLRILYSGDSWHRFMPDYMGRLGKAADIKDQSARWSGKTEEIAELLVKGEIDVMSWGRPGGSSGQLTEFLKQNVLENGLKGKSDFRLYVQMAWMVHDGLGKSFQSKDDYDNSKIAEVQAVIDRERAKVEAIADELNRKHGRQVIFLVPLGDATTKLRAMIVEGKFPGVTKQSAIFADAMPHAGAIAAELAAYCNYAAIYRTSPVGLQIKDGVPEEQRVLLQKLAWETVSKYPYAGVVKARATDQVPPAGVRISIDGNSWSVWPSLLLPLAKEGGIQGQIDSTKEAKQRLEKGEIDVVTFGTHGKPEDGSFVAKTVELGLKHNPNFRFYQQAAWPIGDARWRNKTNEIKTKDDYDTTKIDELQAATDEMRKGHEGFADGLNKTPGKRVVFIVPVGDAIVKLRALIVAGKFPGVKRQSEIFTDAMPHPGGLVAWLSAYCHFAAFYRIPPPAAAPLPEGADQAKKDSYAQQEILRQIAWETVSKYPYAGVVAVNNPGRTEEKKDTRMLFLGNSITLCPPAESIGWTGNWGMAASSAEKDYVHLVLNAVEKMNGTKAESKVLNLADFERGFEQFDIAAKLKAEIEFQADTVILAIGENVPDLKTDEAKLKFRDSVSRLLKLLKADRRCTIYVRSCFWPNAAKDSALKEACAAVGGVFVDISALSNDEKNYARSERKFANTGIAIHPGDKGMIAIADLIVAAIKEHDGAKIESKPAPAAGVPEALKGWKATHDLPADTVVTDYNEYIEKLPKAERPGVANVKYYGDDAGRNAVAVLVNVGNQQWTHLIVYDKQNKRTGVTKFANGK